MTVFDPELPLARIASGHSPAAVTGGSTPSGPDGLHAGRSGNMCLCLAAFGCHEGCSRVACPC